MGSSHCHWLLLLIGVAMLYQNLALASEIVCEITYKKNKSVCKIIDPDECQISFDGSLKNCKNTYFSSFESFCREFHSCKKRAEVEEGEATAGKKEAKNSAAAVGAQKKSKEEAAKKIVEDMAAAAAAQRKSEKEAAAAQKKSEEMAAAAKKQAKAAEEKKIAEAMAAAVAAQKKSKEEASKKIVEAMAAAVAAQKKSKEEAAKKIVEDMAAAAAAQRKSKEEAAKAKKRKEAKAEAVVAADQKKSKKETEAAAAVEIDNIFKNCECKSKIVQKARCNIYDFNKCTKCDVETCVLKEVVDSFFCTQIDCIPFTTTPIPRTTTEKPPKPTNSYKLWIVISIATLVSLAILMGVVFGIVKIRKTLRARDIEANVSFNSATSEVVLYSRSNEGLDNDNFSID